MAVLKLYADNLSIDHTRWLFLTGDKDEIMDLANEDYFVAAMESPDAPGGFDHSGKILLLDKDARIRGFCEGTDPESVDQMMLLIDELGKTYE
ncbi:MAG: SCO family protein [Bacteroidota bacterium]